MKDLIERLRANGVHTLLAQFTDLHGVAKCKLVPLTHFDELLTDGAGFAGFATWFDMTPAEIRGLVQSSFERNGTIDLQVSGLSYEVRTDAEKRVLEVRLRLPDGTPLAADRTYSVGLSSYIASSYMFSHRDPGRSLQTTVADALLRYLESGADLGVYTRDLVRALSERAPGASRN